MRSAVKNFKPRGGEKKVTNLPYGENSGKGKKRHSVFRVGKEIQVTEGKGP